MTKTTTTTKTTTRTRVPAPLKTRLSALADATAAAAAAMSNRETIVPAMAAWSAVNPAAMAAAVMVLFPALTDDEVEQIGAALNMVAAVADAIGRDVPSIDGARDALADAMAPLSRLCAAADDGLVDDPGDVVRVPLAAAAEQHAAMVAAVTTKRGTRSGAGTPRTVADKPWSSAPDNVRVAVTMTDAAGTTTRIGTPSIKRADNVSNSTRTALGGTIPNVTIDAGAWGATFARVWDGETVTLTLTDGRGTLTLERITV